MNRNGPWNYVAGPSTLGIGVENLALVQQGVAVTMPHYGPRYNVRGSFMPLEGAGQFPLQQSVPMVGLRANGAYLSGAMALEALTDYNRALSKG